MCSFIELLHGWTEVFDGFGLRFDFRFACLIIEDDFLLPLLPHNDRDHHETSKCEPFPTKFIIRKFLPLQLHLLNSFISHRTKRNRISKLIAQLCEFSTFLANFRRVCEYVILCSTPWTALSGTFWWIGLACRHVSQMIRAFGSGSFHFLKYKGCNLCFVCSLCDWHLRTHFVVASKLIEL